MKKLRTFKCDTCQETLERMVYDEVLVVTCSCSEKAKANRCLSSPKCFSNTTGKSPSLN
jgi:hypothetical protein